MQIKLEKMKPTMWQGNHLGTSAAEWTVIGRPDILIYKSAGFGGWKASIPREDCERRRKVIAMAETRKELVEILELRLSTPIIQ